MTLDSTIKLFNEEFGSALEENYNTEIYDAMSASRGIGILKLNRLHDFYSKFRMFAIEKMPKLDKDRVEVVKYNNLFFSLKVIRRVLNLFFNNMFEVAINKRNKVNVIIFKLGERGIILGEMVSNHKEIFQNFQVEYSWNDIFTEFTTTSDMIL